MRTRDGLLLTIRVNTGHRAQKAGLEAPSYQPGFFLGRVALREHEDWMSQLKIGLCFANFIDRAGTTQAILKRNLMVIGTCDLDHAHRGLVMLVPHGDMVRSAASPDVNHP